MTGFKSPNIKDRKATAVVNAANKQGIKIEVNEFISDSFLLVVLISIYLTIT